MLLSPYRVLDLTDLDGGLCGQVLADLGAEVIQVEPPAGAAARTVAPHTVSDDPSLSSLFWRGYARGKRSVVLDFENDGATFEQLVRKADVLIESSGLHKSNFDYRTLSAINPALIYVSITPYGLDGPKADWAASDLTLMASAGPLAMTGDEDRPPVRVSVPQAWHHAASEAMTGTLVALQERAISGLGQHVVVSAQQAVTLATQGNILAAAVGEVITERSAGGIKVGDMRLRLTYPASDGFVSITHIFGATVGPATHRLMQYVYDNGFCDAATRDKDWEAYGVLLATEQEPISEWERVKECVAACTASKTKDELLAAAMERKLLLAPMTTIEDVVQSEQFASRDYFTTLQDDDSGTHYPGAFAKFSNTPLHTPRRAPSLGEHTEEVLAQLTSWPDVELEQNPAPDKPLAGVKVLDFMWALAGPGATRILADFGATVIRIESSSKLDVCRTIRPFIDGDELPEKSAVFHSTNAGKRMLTLDVNHPESLALIKDLLRWADVVTESFSPKVMKGLGLSYAEVKEINPSIIMLSTCLMGQTGPLAQFAGYGNLAAAVAGFYNITGWQDREPAGPFGAYTDYIAPRFNATAILAALDHRRRTGEGQYIDLAQAEAAMHFLTPALLDYTANGNIQGRNGNQDQMYAPHGVYPVVGEDKFIAIACMDDDHWQNLLTIMPTLDQPDFQTLQDRLTNNDELDSAMAALCQSYEGSDLETALQELGIPSSLVLNSPELVTDPQLKHLGHFIDLPHHETGKTTIESGRVHLSRHQQVVDESAPTFARDMMYVLTDVLGYDDEKVGELLVSGALD